MYMYNFGYYPRLSNVVKIDEKPFLDLKLLFFKI